MLLPDFPLAGRVCYCYHYIPLVAGTGLAPVTTAYEAVKFLLLQPAMVLVHGAAPRSRLYKNRALLLSYTSLVSVEGFEPSNSWSQTTRRRPLGNTLLLVGMSGTAPLVSLYQSDGLLLTYIPLCISMWQFTQSKMHLSSSALRRSQPKGAAEALKLKDLVAASMW